MELQLMQISKQLPAGFSLIVNELHFESSYIYAIVGPPGAGKTSLLRIAGLVDEPESGNVFFTGDFKQGLQGTRGIISYVGTKPYLFNTTVRENIACSLSPNTGAQAKNARINLALEVCGLDHLAKRPVHYLNAGEIRRVALARAVAANAKFVLMDEPTKGVDQFCALQLENALRKVNRQLNAGIIFATEDMQRAKRLADRVLYMQQGQVFSSVESGFELGAGRQII